MKSLTPSNALHVLTSSDFDGLPQTEPQYGAEYDIVEFNPDLAVCDHTFTLPLKNVFIPNTVDLVHSISDSVLPIEKIHLTL